MEGLLFRKYYSLITFTLAADYHGIRFALQSFPMLQSVTIRGEQSHAIVQLLEAAGFELKKDVRVTFILVATYGQKSASTYQRTSGYSVFASHY
jgi:hypothetical protein